MDKEVERVRPEYLDPIGKKRSGFPWLLLVGTAVAVLAVLGLKQHIATQAAWEARFSKLVPAEPETAQIKQAEQIDAAAAEARLHRLALVRRQREEARMQRQKDAMGWRCINGTPFRKIEGGWENVPGEKC